MITVNLENDDQNDLFVSVTDLNRAGLPLVLNQVRINQGESLAVEVQEDGHGSGKVAWAAQQVDYPTRTVHRTVTVSSGDTVEVTIFFG
jgi:predicted RNA-binding protein with TRAM domain